MPDIAVPIVDRQGARISLAATLWTIAHPMRGWHDRWREVRAVPR